jgi:hypothetical protein
MTTSGEPIWGDEKSPRQKNKPMLQLSQNFFALDLLSPFILASGFLLIAPSQKKMHYKYIMDLSERN